MYAPNVIAMVLGLGTTALLLAGACRPGPACSPKDLAAIEAAYSARVVAACHGQSFDECPDVPALKAERDAEEKSGGCR